MARFAEKTKVPVSQSRQEVERLVERYGATAFVAGWQGDRAVVQFEMNKRRLRFVLHLPGRDAYKSEQLWQQDGRRRWRSLLLAIKGKLESVASEIETFDDAFMANIVMPDGLTVSEHVQPKIGQAYLSGSMPPLLPDYSGNKS